MSKIEVRRKIEAATAVTLSLLLMASPLWLASTQADKSQKSVPSAAPIALTSEEAAELAAMRAKQQQLVADRMGALNAMLAADADRCEQAIAAVNKVQRSWERVDANEAAMRLVRQRIVAAHQCPGCTFSADDKSLVQADGKAGSK